MKIGDTVKILETQVYTYFPVGHIGKVTDIKEGALEGKECTVYEVDDGNDYWYYPLHKLGLVTE